MIQKALLQVIFLISFRGINFATLVFTVFELEDGILFKKSKTVSFFFATVAVELTFFFFLNPNKSKFYYPVDNSVSCRVDIRR
jgi:hypothetical protein